MTLLKTVSHDDDTPLALLAHLRSVGLMGGVHGAPDELLLHSGGPHGDLARQSLLMGPTRRRYIVRQSTNDPLPADHSPLAGEIRLQDGPAPLHIEIEDWDGRWNLVETIESADLASGLRTICKGLQPHTSDAFSPGGLAGLLTYDMVQHTQPLRLRHPPATGTPLMVLYRADRWLIHDRTDGIISAHSSIVDDAWLDAVEDIEVPPLPPLEPPIPRTPASESDASHAEKVRLTQAAIREGVLYQLNYGRLWSAPIEDPWAVFRRLARDNPAPLAAYLSAPDLSLAVASSSPELLLRQTGHTVSTRPIKGTRPRGDDAEHDANLRGELAGSRKEIAEHLMLVDLERNDLGRTCRPGSVRWKRWRIESYPNVQHMVSEIEGELAEGADGFDALNAVFPGGSITGCPKTATIAAIDELEGASRGVWTGSIGHIDPRTGISEWNILIRTLEAHRVENEWRATIQAGGGLVIASDPLEEVEEAKWKAQALCLAAWDHAPAGDAVHSPRDGGPASIHPIPPVTPAVRRLLKSRESGLVTPRAPVVPTPMLWQPGLTLTAPSCARVLFVDNLDSFSWNIVHAFASLDAEVIIVPGRRDSAGVESLLAALKPTHIVLGPGPGRPEQSALTMAFAAAALTGQTPPLFGICLGHQAIGLAAGWHLGSADHGAVHGVPEAIISATGPLIMTRYHSLALHPTNTTLEVTATDAATDSLVMGLAHPSLPIEGVQFHPESAGSVEGMTILSDFLSR